MVACSELIPDVNALSKNLLFVNKMGIKVKHIYDFCIQALAKSLTDLSREVAPEGLFPGH